MKRNGFFYVTFHGYDYAAIKSARGVAKTPDFVNWLVFGYDLPGDSIFSTTDCLQWNVAWNNSYCVGGGEGSILINGDYYYQLIESPDISLACLTEYNVQNWVLGLLRAPNLYFYSGQWEQFSVNPTIIPWEKFGCALQYHRLFTDNINIYLSYWINDFPTGATSMKIFRLVNGTAPLPMVASVNQY